MAEKLSQEHVEYSKGDVEPISDSSIPPSPPSAEWEEEKPRLNTQMVLAFIVSLEVAPTFIRQTTNQTIGVDNAIQRLHLHSTNPIHDIKHYQC